MSAAFRRITRARRVMIHAAELLEDEAGSLKTSHTVNGEWRITEEADASAKRSYDDMIDAARQLRDLAGAPNAG